MPDFFEYISIAANGYVPYFKPLQYFKPFPSGTQSVCTLRIIKAFFAKQV